MTSTADIGTGPVIRSKRQEKTNKCLNKDKTCKTKILTLSEFINSTKEDIKWKHLEI